jgi:hypothetical protein
MLKTKLFVILNVIQVPINHSQFIYKYFAEIWNSKCVHVKQHYFSNSYNRTHFFGPRALFDPITTMIHWVHDTVHLIKIENSIGLLFLVQSNYDTLRSQFYLSLLFQSFWGKVVLYIPQAGYFWMEKCKVSLPKLSIFSEPRLELCTYKTVSQCATIWPCWLPIEHPFSFMEGPPYPFWNY